MGSNRNKKKEESDKKERSDKMMEKSDKMMEKSDKKEESDKLKKADLNPGPSTSQTAGNIFQPFSISPLCTVGMPLFWWIMKSLTTRLLEARILGGWPD